jgi:hypothetical protein
MRALQSPHTDYNNHPYANTIPTRIYDKGGHNLTPAYMQETQHNIERRAKAITHNY